MALGIYYLHCFSPPVLHLDLKSANVLLDELGTAKVLTRTSNPHHGGTRRGALGARQGVYPVVSPAATPCSAVQP